ncbi:MAG: xanthine dehydrogenase family protein molybdopterin-binding subunit [Acidobacteria bacterium]|nr:xanthine dehydrogenase family protein molybdopterin-binding subunit [Acidobacteriota bacterium]
MLHAGFVRSPHAHALIKFVDTSKAQSAPGVVAVLTAEDVRGQIGAVPCAAVLPDMKAAPRPVLATGRVRFVGEAVAVVIASDRYALRDALDLVDVDYESLTPVVDPEKAISKGAPVLHEPSPDNVAYRWELEGGDIKKAFKQADRVIRQRILNQRLVPVAMEPRGVLAEYKPGEKTLTVWSSTQIPHLLKTQLAAMLGAPEHSVRVITPEVGGGFGSKLNVYPEEAVIAHLAMRLGRPVKWVETRRENFLCTIHGRDQIGDVEAAVTKDGVLLGVKWRIVADLGAYYQLLTPLIPTLTGLMLAGCYKVPAIRIEIIGALTNKMSTDAYRGAGRPEATYYIERLMDLIAAELKKDPAEIRRKNFPQPKDFPYATPTGVTYDSANYQKSLDLALQKSGYAKLRKEQAKLRKQGRYLGIGLSTYVEICAMGPSSAMPAGGWESATVRVEPTGKVTILTGASPHGQGQETSFAQMGAEILGLTPDDVHVVHGDTAAVPYGIGTFGSRGTAVGGTAAYKSLIKLRDKLAQIAGHLMGEDPQKLVFGDGRIWSKSAGNKSIGLIEAIGAAYVAKTLPPGMEPGLDATTFFEPSNFTFPFGAHVCVVEIDAETGDVRLLKYVAVDDCGNVLNPLLVEGQVHGGIVQAVGQAMFEEAVYDEHGQLITGELMDYALPRAGALPWMETHRTVTPSPVNPLGVKGVGEAGTIGATPAIINAVVDALAPFGVRHVDMPAKRERIWKLMHEAPPRRAPRAPAKAAARRQAGRRAK